MWAEIRSLWERLGLGERLVIGGYVVVVVIQLIVVMVNH